MPDDTRLAILAGSKAAADLSHSLDLLGWGDIGHEEHVANTRRAIAMLKCPEDYRDELVEWQAIIN